MDCAVFAKVHWTVYKSYSLCQDYFDCKYRTSIQIFLVQKKKFIVISVCEIRRSSLLYTYLDLEVSVTYFLLTYLLWLYLLCSVHI